MKREGGQVDKNKVGLFLRDNQELIVGRVEFEMSHGFPREEVK